MSRNRIYNILVLTLVSGLLFQGVVQAKDEVAQPKAITKQVTQPATTPQAVKAVPQKAVKTVAVTKPKAEVKPAEKKPVAITSTVKPATTPQAVKAVPQKTVKAAAVTKPKAEVKPAEKKPVAITSTVKPATTPQVVKAVPQKAVKAAAVTKPKAEVKPAEKKPVVNKQEAKVINEPKKSKEKPQKKKRFFAKKEAITPTNKTKSTFEIAPDLIDDAKEQLKSEKKKEQEQAKSQKEKRAEEVTTTPAQTTINAGVEVNQIISIDDCIKLALANNPSIRSAVYNAEVYKTKIGQAWSNYFPTVGAALSYSRNDMLVTNFAPPTQKYNLFYAPQVQATQLIFDFGKTKVSADIAKKGYESSENMLQSSVNDVVYATKQAYYNLLYAIEQEKVYAKTVKDYETHLKQAKAYYAIGSKAKIDVTTAEYNLGNAKLNYIKSKNNIKMTYARLNNAIGLPEYTNYEVKDKLGSNSGNVAFEAAINKAYELRPQLLAAQNKFKASELLVKVSARAFMPDISAFGSYISGGKNVNSDNSYQLGAQIGYQNTNFMMLKKQVDEAKATYRKDKADYEKVRQDVYLEIKQAHIEYLNAKESIPVSKIAMQKAKEQYDLASGRYKVGLGDAVELKDAETTYRSAQLEYYNTLLNFNIAESNLEKSVGAPLTSIVSSVGL